MLFILSIVSGTLIAVMIVQNGDLAVLFGNYHSAVIVHAVGLASILLWMIIRREKFRLDRSTPLIFLTGGVFGVLTVVLNNVCFLALGVSVTLSLGLLGQCVAGGLADHFGWFGMRKKPFRRRHLLSFALIVAGIAVMMWG